MKRINKRSIITKITCRIDLLKHNGTWYTLYSISYTEGKLYLIKSGKQGKNVLRLRVNEDGVILAIGCCNSLDAEYDSCNYNNVMSLQTL